MTGETLLLRQIHPSFIQNGFPTSQAFRPTPKDESKLSVYDGEQITAELAFLHFTLTWKLASVGVMAFSVAECSEENLPTLADPLFDCPEHALVDFSGLNDKQCYKKSKRLQDKSRTRGWLHQASSAS
jgi:hypothetical protein